MREEDVLLFWNCHGVLNIVGQEHGKELEWQELKMDTRVRGVRQCPSTPWR
jgi:hypothetical protein